MIAFTSMANATTMLAGTATGPSSSASPYVVNVPAIRRFANTDLDHQLKEHGIEKIIIIGMLANTCIESTGRFGMELGYHVTLVKDATADLQSRGDACGARDQWADESVMRRNPRLPHPSPRPVRRAKIKNIHWHDKTPFFKGLTWFAVVVRATSSS